MSVVWTVLGVILVLLVITVLVLFFIVRPRLARTVNSGARTLARELHGRKPLMSGAAVCEGCTDEAKGHLVGLGAIALTEQALVFASGSADATVIIPRSEIRSSTISSTAEIRGRSLNRGQPLLVVTWTRPAPPLATGVGEPSEPVETTIVFLLAQPESWARPLAESSAERHVD